MRHLSREQFLAILKLPEANYDAMQRTGQAALAFTVSRPQPPGQYLDLDLVAMAMVLAMTPTIRRELAAAIVRGFFNQWVSAVGHAEDDPGQHYSLGVLQEQAQGQAVGYVVSSGTREELMRDFHGLHGTVMAIDITDILARLRANAREIGLDLSQAFFWPPDHPRFAQIIEEFKQIREQRVARFRRDRKRFRAHQQMLNQHAVRVAARVAETNPFDRDRAEA
jgi:hypothetical protein